ANEIVRDLGLQIDRSDPTLKILMDLLKGHPLAMRVVLSKLGNQTASQLTDRISANFAQLLPTATDESEAMLFATLHFITDSLPEPWLPLLHPLSMHNDHVDANLLEMMAQHTDAGLPRSTIDECLAAFAHAGVVHRVGSFTFELHPLFPGFLRTHPIM